MFKLLVILFQKVLTRKNTLLKQAKTYVDNLNSAKVNKIDPSKDNFSQPLSTKGILDELEILKSDYYGTLSILKDEDLELNLKETLIFTSFIIILILV